MAELAATSWNGTSRNQGLVRPWPEPSYRMVEVGGPHVKSKSYFAPLTIFFPMLAFVFTMPAQENSAEVAKLGPPKFLNMVHQELKPGKIGAYDDLETSIVRG